MLTYIYNLDNISYFISYFKFVAYYLYTICIYYSQEMASHGNSHEIISISSGESDESISIPLITEKIPSNAAESCCSINKPESLSTIVHTLSSIVSSSCHDTVHNFKLECTQLPLMEESDVSEIMNSCTELEGLCTFFREMFYSQHYESDASSSIIHAYETHLRK